jgi:uncharacterized repeat protein (TIGR01451 family)
MKKRILGIILVLGLVLALTIPISIPAYADVAPPDANQNALHLDIGRAPLVYHDGDTIHYNVTVSVPARNETTSPPYHPANQTAISANFTRPDGIVITFPVIAFMQAGDSVTFTHANDGTGGGLDTGLDYVIKHVNEDVNHQVRADAEAHSTSHSSATNDTNDQAANIKTTVHHPALSVTKTADEISKIGDSVTYHITVTNTGDIALDRVSVVDSLSGNITTSFPATLAVSASSGPVAFTRTVLAGDPNPLVNTVTAIYQDSDAETPGAHVTATDSDTASTNLVNPNYTITKSANPTTGPVGTTITYTVTLNNTGDVQLDLISANDSLVVSGFPTFPATLAIGAGVPITYTRNIQVGDTSPVNNIITTVYRVHGLTNQLTRVASAQVTIPGVPHTQLQTISANPSTIPDTGGQVTITVTDKNDGTVDLTGASFILTGNPSIGTVTMTHIASDPGDFNDPGVMNQNEIWTFTATVTVSGATTFTAIGHTTGPSDVTGLSETGTVVVPNPPKTPASSNLTIGLSIAGLAGVIIFFSFRRRRSHLQS